MGGMRVKNSIKQTKISSQISEAIRSLRVDRLQE
jgi:hypothetical protein